MKSASFVPSVLRAAFIGAAVLMGCSGDKTLPTESGNTTALPEAPTLHKVTEQNTIHVDTTLVDPFNKSALIEVAGDISYAVQPLPVLGKNAVRAAISFQGQAISPLLGGPMGGVINGKSDQTLSLDQHGLTTFDDTYEVTGNNLVLNVGYLISNTKVQVAKMALEAYTPGN